MKLLTLSRDLRRRKARERQGLFVAEGVRTVEELLASPVAVVGALVGPQLAATPRGVALAARLHERGIPVTEVTQPDFESAAETESPQGVLAVGRVPDRSLEDLDVASGARLLVLDGVQDPGNVGTILRTAAALGASATLALPGTVDLWNAKVVRSAMGAHFLHPALGCTWEDFDAFRARHRIPLWGADAAGRSMEEASPPERVALAVGNEGHGLSAPARARADTLVAIPIASTVESLNVAVATGIFLYLLRR